VWDAVIQSHSQGDVDGKVNEAGVTTATLDRSVDFVVEWKIGQFT